MFKSTAVKVLISSVIFIVVLEIGLRTLTNKYYTYIERIGYDYISPYDEMGDSWYHAYQPNTVFDNTRTEFSFSYEINELGIIDEPVQTTKSDKYKILCLGDSFTEGVGAPYEKSWPRLLETKLNNLYPDSIQVINGGIGGSDLFYSWKLYEDRLFQYEPDEIIFFIGASDLEDVMIKGGDERFLPDSTVSYTDPPVYEPLFRYSFIFRAIVLDILDYSHFLKSSKSYDSGIKQSCQLLDAKLADIKKTLSTTEIKMRLVLHPVANEVREHEYPFSCFGELGDSLNIDRLDLLKEINQDYNFNNFESYYWPIDNHFTEKGYEICASYVFNFYKDE